MRLTSLDTGSSTAGTKFGRRVGLTILVLICSCVLMAGAVSADSWDGSVNIGWYTEGGTSYSIGNASQLAGLAKLVNDGNSFSGKTIQLTADIDLDNRTWTPIGLESNPFKGTFDGKYHTIEKLEIPVETYDMGLFGYTDGAIIQNLIVSEINISVVTYPHNPGKTSESAGGLVGRTAGQTLIKNSRVSDVQITSAQWWSVCGGVIGVLNETSSIDNCTASKVTITMNAAFDDSKGNMAQYAGGFVGQVGSNNLPNAIVTKCSVVEVTVTSLNELNALGGFVGYCSGQIDNCSVTGVVRGTGKDIGGFVGQERPHSKITDCYSNVEITVTNTWKGETNVGGFVGTTKGSTLENCYAVGNITGTRDSQTNVGGFLGQIRNDSNTPTTIRNCVVLVSSISATQKEDNIGRFIGYVLNDSQQLTNTYGWSNLGYTDNSGTPVKGGSYNGTGVSSAQLWGEQSFFSDTLGWKFSNVWKMNSGNDNYQLPILAWQKTPVSSDASYLKPKSVDHVAELYRNDRTKIASYETIQKAVDAAQTGDTIKIIHDIEYGTFTTPAPIIITSDKDLTLDLNGHTMSGVTDMQGGTMKSAGNTALIRNQGTLTITDNSPDELGTLEVTATKNDPSYQSSSAVILNEGTLTIKGGNLTHHGGTSLSYAIDSLSGGGSNVDLTVKGGTLISKEYVVIRAFANSVSTWSNITINGGTLTGAKRVVCIQQPSDAHGQSYLKITGGAFELKKFGTVATQGIVVFEHYGDGTGLFADISGGMFRADSVVWGMITFGDDTSSGTGEYTKVNVTGGTFTYDGSGKAVYNVSNKISNTKILKGGFYSNDVTAFCVEGYTASKMQMNGKDYYAVGKIVEPKVPISAGSSDGGKTTTITAIADSGTPITVDTDAKTATIIDNTGSGTTMTIQYSSMDSSSGTSVTGVVKSVEVAYPAISITPPLEGAPGTTFNMKINMDGVETALPQVSAVPDEKNQKAIAVYDSNFKLVSMISVVSTLKTITKIDLEFRIPKSWVEQNSAGSVLRIVHVADNDAVELIETKVTDGGDYYIVTGTGNSFSSYGTVLAPIPPVPPVPPVPVSDSSSDGNMENAFRVLFNTNGGSFVQPATGLSYGDRVPEPGTPTKDGYVFGGWYKDEALNILWIFKEDALPGDMTLYAKWISGSVATAVSPQSDSVTQSTAVATQQQQAVATAVTSAATTSPAGVSPMMTQAPAPVAGLLFGILAAGLFLRRRT
ncbi:hypothetical protein McpSp1_07760 [Methanocorpusculaceae archaeon Sp1]|nr:hypothetical protein [Methanocorpusculaceae archaeon Sp1]